MHFKNWHVVFALACTLLLADIGSAAIWYVDADATGTESGLSWPNAFTDIQPALDIANPLTDDEVWVAAAVYTPTERTDQNDARSATYLIDSDLDGIKIYGGFIGGETDLIQRDPEANETELDGNIGSSGDRTDNLYRICTAIGVESGTIIDGFTIKNSFNDRGPGSAGSGGGMYCEGASPTIARCRFVRNYADQFGGGLCATLPVGTDPLFAINCSFLGNSAGYAGGGFGNDGVVAIAVNCIFVGNQCASPDLGGGGFAAPGNGQSGSLTNCTFVANSTAAGGDLAGGAYFDANQSSPQPPDYLIENCNFWDNVPTQLTHTECVQTPPGSLCQDIKMSDCDVEGGVPPHIEDVTGNIDDDPLFVRAPDPGADNEWGTADDDYGDLRLALGSPCINTGSNSYLPADFGDLNTNSNYSERTPRDLDVFRKRVLHGTVEMGAYEFGCNADLTNDCEIDGDDQAVLVGQWTGTSTYGGCPPYRQSDLNEDCKINGLDLAILLSAWGECDACGSESLGGGGGGGDSSQESGCEGGYALFLQWLEAENWAAFLQWYACMSGQ